MQVFSNFYENVDKRIKKHLVVMAEQKGGHGNYNGNGATATFRVIRQLIEMSVQEKMWMNGSCEDGGVIPDTGFPMGRRHGNRGGTTNVHGRKQQLNMHLIQHMLLSMGHCLGGYTFEACIFGVARVRR